MTDKDKPSISFGDGATIGNFQTGENAHVGDKVSGDKIAGDKVEGDKMQAGVISTGDNATVDASGQVVSFGDIPAGPLSDLFDLIRTELSASESAAFSSDDSMPEFPQTIVDAANENSFDLTDPTSEQQEAIDGFDGYQLVGSMENELAKEESEQDRGFLSGLIRRTREFAPRIGRGLLKAGEEALMSQVKKSTGVATALGFIAGFKGE